MWAPNLRARIEILDPEPSSLGYSYGDMRFTKYGVCAWSYNGYRGAIEWVNSKRFITEPKMSGVTGFDFYFVPGVLAKVTFVPVVRDDLPGVYINGVPVNPATGQGFPIALP